ncbi:MAG: class I SAM-dependent RNA methyltransferase [Treponema sp.]|nr:class I SAM-dependent RNA methyltransferase [Treponema sp.]
MNTLLALCAIGAEKILGNEIKHLGYKLSESSAGRVSFIGDDDSLFRSNLCLRTADRIFLQIEHYEADNFDSLYDAAFNINWEDYFKKDVRIVIDKVRSRHSVINSEHTVQRMIHKAIYSRLGEKWNMRVLPATGDEQNIRVYIDKNQVYLLLDLSGEALHKRGYRTKGGAAPIRETLAASLLHEMIWRRKTPLHDPFCGSGTIPIEATLYAHNVAPGFGRKFALETLAFFNRERAEEIKTKEAEKIRCDVEVRITGSDIDPSCVSLAQKNAEYACSAAGRALQLIGKNDHIPRPEFIQSDFSDLHAPYENGLILCNPPYGERLGNKEETESLYKKMSILWPSFPNWNFGIVTTSEEFEKLTNHPASSKKHFKSGNLENYFYIYKNEVVKNGVRKKSPIFF